MIQVKNVSEEEVTVRVRIGGEDNNIALEPGKTALTEIKSSDLRVLEKRGLISCKELEPMTEVLNEDINNDEPMDKFHVTESITVKVEQKLIDDLDEFHNINAFDELTEAAKSISDSGNPSVTFDIVDSAVDKAKQKVEEYSNEENTTLKTGRWEDDEIKLLKKVYPKKGGKIAAEELNRSYKAIQKKVANLNLKRKYKK